MEISSGVKHLIWIISKILKPHFHLSSIDIEKTLHPSQTMTTSVCGNPPKIQPEVDPLQNDAGSALNLLLPLLIALGQLTEEEECSLYSRKKY